MAMATARAVAIARERSLDDIWGPRFGVPSPTRGQALPSQPASNSARHQLGRTRTPMDGAVTGHHSTHPSRLRRVLAALAERWSLRLTAAELPQRNPIEAAHWEPETEREPPVVPLPRAMRAELPAAVATRQDRIEADVFMR